MTTETFTDRAAFLAALHGTPRQKRGRATRPDIPSAPRAPRTGLSKFIKAGWNWTFQVGSGYRLDQGALSSGWQPDEATCCEVAKRVAAQAAREG